MNDWQKRAAKLKETRELAQIWQVPIFVCFQKKTETEEKPIQIFSIKKRYGPFMSSVKFGPLTPKSFQKL